MLAGSPIETISQELEGLVQQLTRIVSSSREQREAQERLQEETPPDLSKLPPIERLYQAALNATYSREF